MKHQYTIVLGKCYPGPDEEDWPTEENTSTTYIVNGIKNLRSLINNIVNLCPAPWWWIFDGDMTEDNLVLSGAIDPDDIDILEENLF